MGKVLKAVISTEVRLLDTRDVATVTGFSEVTLRRWRVEGGGPPFLRLGGRSVRYHPDHVENWALDNMCVYPSARSGKERRHGSL
jgi:predicted DNA-binding transcriptional regulator AlpA